ncbi:hypothetical protein T484DRAFT_1820366, partial [Baffinella frigidus]
EAGLLKDDKVVKIDGKSTEGLSPFEAIEALQAGPGLSPFEVIEALQAGPIIFTFSKCDNLTTHMRIHGGWKEREREAWL